VAASRPVRPVPSAQGGLGQIQRRLGIDVTDDDERAAVRVQALRVQRGEVVALQYGDVVDRGRLDRVRVVAVHPPQERDPDQMGGGSGRPGCGRAAGPARW
jgi:hypothetical protein